MGLFKTTNIVKSLCGIGALLTLLGCIAPIRVPYKDAYIADYSLVDGNLYAMLQLNRGMHRLPFGEGDFFDNKESRLGILHLDLSSQDQKENSLLGAFIDNNPKQLSARGFKICEFDSPVFPPAAVSPVVTFPSQTGRHSTIQALKVKGQTSFHSSGSRFVPNEWIQVFCDNPPRVFDFKKMEEIKLPVALAAAKRVCDWKEHDLPLTVAVSEDYQWMATHEGSQTFRICKLPDFEEVLRLENQTNSAWIFGISQIDRQFFWLTSDVKRLRNESLTNCLALYSENGVQVAEGAGISFPVFDPNFRRVISINDEHLEADGSIVATIWYPFENREEQKTISLVAAIKTLKSLPLLNTK